jgi:hypothetical protein
MSQVESVTLGEEASMWARIIKLKKQNLIFGIIHIGNVKVVPTFRINFSNFPWQLLDAYRPAGCACPSMCGPALGQAGRVSCSQNSNFDFWGYMSEA